jgi:hypothetical protein
VGGYAPRTLERQCAAALVRPSCVRPLNFIVWGVSVDTFLRLLNSSGTALGAIGASIAFIWSVFQFFSIRAREAKAREFETFHKLIKNLVEPAATGTALYVDRQFAVLYELRFFPRYYPFTRRTLIGLKTTWSLGTTRFPRILEEIEITLNLIDGRSNTVLRRIGRKLHILSPAER